MVLMGLDDGLRAGQSQSGVRASGYQMMVVIGQAPRGHSHGYFAVICIKTGPSALMLMRSGGNRKWRAAASWVASREAISWCAPGSGRGEVSEIQVEAR